MKVPYLFAVIGVSALAIGPQVQAQGLNLDGYCKTLYGGRASAVLLNQRDAYTWRCTTGSGMAEMSIEDACRRTYGLGHRATLGNRANPYSWTCRR